MSTSLTDTFEYRAFCAAAAGDDTVFQTFRRQPEYEHIVRVSPEDGGRYLARLDEPPVAAADTTGDPRMHSYPGYGVPLDPVLVRYHHDRQEIRRHFGDLDGLSVLEIGGGFGGLARLLIPEVGSYAICDLPEVRRLQDRYLARFGDQVDDACPYLGYDLVVSTFAFSELGRSTMLDYADEYLYGCPSGWMICNFLAVEQVYADEMIALMPAGARFEPETPETHVANRVIVWGDRR